MSTSQKMNQTKNSRRFKRGGKGTRGMRLRKKRMGKRQGVQRHKQTIFGDTIGYIFDK